MCGIAGIHITQDASARGITSPGGSPLAVNESLERMVTKLEHRGPDDRGSTWIRGSACAVGLGHTRLTILDLSSAGHQPMHDPHTGNWITFNGEIYNFKEIRHQLANDPGTWRSKTDTETILRAYAQWGVDCLSRLRGMFAFAIWDAQRQKLFIARDRLGIKPLYYYPGQGFFLFSSEVRALLASELMPRSIDPKALCEYLAYQSVPSPKTLVEGVLALPPGSWLMVDASVKVTEGCYWSLLGESSAGAHEPTPGEARQHVRDLLRESTALHLVSDVPVGVFLSGGIDSSAVVALMHEQGKVARTYSVVFCESAYNEANHARRVATRFATDHTEICLTEQSLLEQLPDALMAMDQPTGDGINTYVIAKAVRDAGVKVALSGLGGDEFFAGYPSFSRLVRAVKYMRRWGRIPVPLRALAAEAVRVLGGPSVKASKMSAIIGSDGSLAEIFPVMRQVLSSGQRRLLLRKPWRQFAGEHDDPYVKLLRETYVGTPWAGPLTQISYAEGRTYMHDVLLRDTDQMSMAHGLEVRVPLLDHQLVEYVMNLADAHKSPNGTPKQLLVESLGDLLPREIVHRPKQGFTLPFAVWMQGALRKFCEARLEPERINSRGIFEPEQVSKLWRAFLDHRPSVSWSRIWVLIVLEEWMEKNEVSCPRCV